MSFTFNFPNPADKFTFNFPNPADNGQTEDENKDCENEVPDDKSEHVEEFREILSSEIGKLARDLPKQSFQLSDSICIQCVDSQAVEQRLCDIQGPSCGVTAAAKQHSDLIPNVYEGGLKVWECAVDLAEYLLNYDIQFNSKQVLELGCGAGLPGIVAMLKGAACLHFQDYNFEVVEHYTIPNLILNLPDECTCTCRYFSGDWDSFKEHMSNENIHYDVILSAETIYKPENYRKLTAIFENFLSPGGEIYIAAKSNYFGVGGGTRDFECFVRKAGRFKVDTCCTIEAGVPREIMKLTRKK